MSCLEAIDLDDFNTTLKKDSCSKCILASLVRTKVVISRGNVKSKIMIVGQNPGAKEDEFGLPFLGRAGALLDKMFSAINIDTNKDCYVTNAVLCWTPNNENPADYPNVLSSCSVYLKKQIALLDPKIIVAVGKPAFESLIGTPTKDWLKNIAGKVTLKPSEESSRYIFPILHPAYLLRNESAKPIAWEHMRLLSALVETQSIISDYRKVE
jgi:DNA polymerase